MGRQDERRFNCARPHSHRKKCPALGGFLGARRKLRLAVVAETAAVLLGAHNGTGVIMHAYAHIKIALLELEGADLSNLYAPKKGTAL